MMRLDLFDKSHNRARHGLAHANEIFYRWPLTLGTALELTAPPKLARHKQQIAEGTQGPPTCFGKQT